MAEYRAEEREGGKERRQGQSACRTFSNDFFLKEGYCLHDWIFCYLTISIRGRRDYELQEVAKQTNESGRIHINDAHEMIERENNWKGIVSLPISFNCIVWVRYALISLLYFASISSFVSATSNRVFFKWASRSFTVW